MTLDQWFIFFLIVQAVHFAGTWKLYEAAGRKRWEAAIPVYNAIVLMKIINRPTWWTILLFIPIVNLIMFPVVWVETLRSFGRNSSTDTWLAVLTFGLYIYYVNYTQKLNYVTDRDLYPRTKRGETVSSILFAIVVATMVHTYFMQPFTIPTSSLEKSLLVGDFLFVSKFHYGARVPMTTVAAPMVHDTIPVLRVKSYSKWPQAPYFRFPGMETIENNDIVVFNWPVDTVRQFFKAEARVDKPIDKKSNYVKRCVGIPGDSLKIVDGEVYINNKKLILPERARPQHSFFVTIDGKTPIDFEHVMKELDITDRAGYKSERRDTLFFSSMTDDTAARLRNIPGITSVTKKVMPASYYDGAFPKIGKGNGDNFPSLYIPQAGKTVALDTKVLPYYKKIITEYEHNDLKVNGDEIRINGKPATSYTFQQNYYWMMGDNRHNSEDSRYWGYVPENHIVGKPVFIWMSISGINDGIKNWRIRWDRVFTTVSGDGERTSYFKYFLLLLGAYVAWDYFRKKKKAA
ncbi:Signal peptidase I [Flavobacterium longum]|uniref:signal peptidase I n=1 Tax=Flavobacterium longum TaxID=1299340 RepID=UPI0039E7C735